MINFNYLKKLIFKIIIIYSKKTKDENLLCDIDYACCFFIKFYYFF